MALFNPARRAASMTVGTAEVLLQMTEEPMIFGCAEVVANRLCKATAGAPACAEKTYSPTKVPRFQLTHYGAQVKEQLEKRIRLA